MDRGTEGALRAVTRAGAVLPGEPRARPFLKGEETPAGVFRGSPGFRVHPLRAPVGQILGRREHRGADRRQTAVRLPGTVGDGGGRRGSQPPREPPAFRSYPEPQRSPARL